MAIKKALKTGTLVFLAILFTVSVFTLFSFNAYQEFTSQEAYTDIYQYEFREDVRMMHDRSLESIVQESSAQCSHGWGVSGVYVPCRVLESGDTEKVIQYVGEKRYPDSKFKEINDTVSQYSYIPWIVTGFLALIIAGICRSPKGIVRWWGGPLLLVGGLFTISRQLIISMVPRPDAAATLQNVEAFSSKLAYLSDIGLYGALAGIGLLAVSFLLPADWSSIGNLKNVKIVVEKEKEENKSEE